MMPSSSPLDVTAFYAILRELQFDLEQLTQLSDHSFDFERELLQLYLGDLQAQLTPLQQAVCAEDWPQIEQITHYIKGASASVGAINFSKLAGTLEQAARQVVLYQTSDPAGKAQDLLRALVCEFELVHQRLAPVLLNQVDE